MLGKIEGRTRRGPQRMRWLDGITDSMDMNEFEQALGVGDRQGSLACCSPWGGKELDTTEQLKWLKDIVFLQFSSVQSLSRVQLFATPWIAALQASLPITNSQSLLKPMSIESVMPSNHLILCHPLLLLPPNLSQHQGLFQWVSSSHEVAKVLEFQLQHQSFQWTPRTDLL